MFASSAFAFNSLGDAAVGLTDSMGYLVQFMTSISYVIGFAFGVGAILKYKIHRDSPNQVSLAVPIVLIFLCLALVFMPMVFAAYGKTIFEPSSQQGSPHGISKF